MFNLIKKHLIREKKEVTKTCQKSETNLLKLVEIFINDGKELIKFRYAYGIWSKFKNGEEVITAEGYTYEDFINQVLTQYPINSVKSFKLNDIGK